MMDQKDPTPWVCSHHASPTASMVAMGSSCEVLCIDNAIDRFSAIGDPVASIGGKEECHANLNDSGVRGVLNEGGVHSVVCLN